MAAAALYRGITAISPHRKELKSHGELTATMMKTKERAQDVEDAVEEDFTLHYRVTDTEDFLKKLLPVEATTVDAILQSMKNQGLYDSQTQRWKGFPVPTPRESGSKEKGKPKEKKPKENSLYGPFTTIAEAIRKVAETQPVFSILKMGSTKWIDYHSKSPASQDSQAAQLRPDNLFAFQTVADFTPSNEPQERQGGKREERQKEGQEAKIELQTIWWLQIIAAVEMKRSNSQNWLDIVKQLFGYLRRILREQLDRRFVFGLTLGPDMMTVWLHDRSGVIGTKTSIDIHKDPARFIQVMASFSLLPPEKLGFDPTIKLLVSPSHAVPSYMPNEDFIKAYQAAPHNRQWVITMNNGLEYMTVETVSSVRAGFIRGRGSIAWVVVLFNGDEESKSKFYVLKQSWRPDGVDSEGELYNEVDGTKCDYVGRIELCESVLISGSEDHTDKLIRQSLDASTGLGKRSTDQRAESADPYIHVTCTDVGDIKEVSARETGPPVARIRTRVLLSTYGWLIKYFSTRRELIEVLRDAIKGHKYLYKRGVLHRDISPGNILIKWRPGSQADQPSTSGCLIDLDRGKKGKLAGDKVKIPVADKMISAVQTAIHVLADVEVEEEVARLSLDFPSMNSQDGPTAIRVRAQIHALAAIGHASKFRGFAVDQLCTPQHLQWNPVKISYDFNFNSSERQKGSRTGTPPYTSGEVLLNHQYLARDHSAFHDAIHDLESFFWVLVHICITRQGPGGVRREELEQKNQDKEEYHGLRRVVHCFFDSDMTTMGMNKLEIFTNAKELEQFVLDNFHCYFQQLRNPVKEWFHLLALAHEFHAFEYYDIHDMVLDILDRALRSLPLDDIDEAAQKVLDDRKANIEKLGSNPFGKVQHPPPLHTSPASQRQAADVAVRYSPPSSPTPLPPSKKAKMLPGPGRK